MPLCAALVRADPAPCHPPAQAAICDVGTVAKTKLANYVLDACGVSRTLEQSLAAAGRLNLPKAQEQQLQSQGMVLTSAERLLVLMPCEPEKSCTDQDRDALRGAYGLVDVLLNYEPKAYHNISQIGGVAQYFVDPQAALACQVGSDGKPIEVPGAIAPKKISWPPNLRIRGSTDGLYFGPDERQIYSVDKATIGSTYGNSNTTRTDKILAFVGYAIFDPTAQPFYNLFPYTGVNRNLARPTGKPESVNSDTIDFGLYNTFLLKPEATTPFTQWITVRPDFLVNHKDDSHLVSANVTYTVVKNCEGGRFCLNAYRPFLNQALYAELILDVRSDWGHYAQPGDMPKTDYRNYWRVGPRAGVSFDSAYRYLPLTLTATDLYLQGISGTLPHLNYFKSVLSYKIVDKFLSIDVSFSNGRREDTAQPEHLWSVALSGAY
jgi:hypothetical protein